MKILDTMLRDKGIAVDLHTGYTATEEAVKRMGESGPEASGSPRILHLATHGFFFPDPKERPSPPAFRGLEAVAPAFKLSDHPMIRSGLILAGANQVWTDARGLDNGEDGVLTAYEISQMNLSNTELVVLSACETGLGDIRGSEGVYGLQRAFKIAGARYLVMSLWEVPDYATQQLMTTFYKKWLEDNMPIPEAFRAAQRAMRERFHYPHFWAGFALVE